ncbi:GTPase EngB [Mesomycoplasma conjunctivae]|uniref:Probable GTP-binding protein EngB n=1 Tax=Mesomycoplasma conjunctivae (strain ATCC 25834 / NCTC 10147 / HRC/581) TaxID=572263 RepID=C5J5P5_MESCH|nr:ribosome biogenesis GTP-binding protein YihA/YsxC [Mesomycoplasma conjunctivae]CAT04770.1 Probable GTP-binding protein engB [Mesomycoplasma conjunctivae]VEU65799.1 GTPase EngB [Mesomycoplasma conjunctivae]
MWTFIKSASSRANWLIEEEQIAFIGRSNVGKSSLINALAKQKIAKVSKHPGRTQLINYFKTDKNKIVVDLPGYGYAKISISQKMEISQMVNQFFQENNKLKAVFLIIDAFVGFTNLDLQMLDYLKDLNIETILVANKIDKTNQSQRSKITNIINKMNYEVILTSSKKQTGLDKIDLKINQILN